MAKYCINPAAGGNSNYYGTLINIANGFTGNVIRGFDVVQNGTPNMTVKVNPGSGMIREGTFPSDVAYHVASDTSGGDSVTIATADPSNARIDYIIGWVDKGVTPSGTNNTNVFKFAAVAGTPSGSPAVPTTTQIQTAIGASNPYDIYAKVAVAAGTTTISSGNITDLRSTATPVIANNGIAAAQLSASAITLAYAQITTTFSTTSTTGVQVTGLSLPVTIPSGGRKVKITFHAGSVSNSTANYTSLTIWDGNVGTGTQLQQGNAGTTASTGMNIAVTSTVIVTPSAGSKTYSAGLVVTGGTGTLSASATAPVFLLVEVI